MKDLRSIRLLAAGMLCFALISAGPAGATVLGIDVSRWQGTIDWPTVAATDLEFAFIKYTDSSDILDPKATRNVPRAKSAGLHVGVYHFATPFAYDRDSAQDFSDNDAVEEATWFVSQAGQFMGTGHLPPVLDIEWGEAAGRTRLTDWSKTFLDTVEDLTGVRPIIYANQWWSSNYLTASELDTDLWIARWTEDPDTPPGSTGSWAGDYLFHQYSASTSVPGIFGNVDGNTFNGTLAELEALVNQTVSIEGDFDGDGSVNQGDLDLVLLNWGEPSAIPPTGWVNDLPTGIIDQVELDKILLNWGATAEASGSAVPEPVSGIALLAGGLWLGRRRKAATF